MQHLVKTPLSQAHQSLPQNEAFEQIITELEISSIEHEQNLTELEIAVDELKAASTSSSTAESTS